VKVFGIQGNINLSHLVFHPRVDGFLKIKTKIESPATINIAEPLLYGFNYLAK